VKLLENFLLKYVEGKRTLKATPKGMQFLCTCNQMGELITAANSATKFSK